jgi:hypothetical protein
MLSAADPVSNSQVIGWRLLQGSANSATFSSFVTDLKVASHHRYSPEYNPVEMAFSVFKAHMQPMLPGADIATAVADRLADMQVRVRQCATKRFSRALSHSCTKRFV